jgi:hypothetical protein
MTHTFPEGLASRDGGAPERREKAQQEVRQQLRKLMADVRAQNESQRGADRDEKRLTEFTEPVDRSQHEVIATLALLIDPVTGQLPDGLQKEIAAEFSDPESGRFIEDLLRSDALRLATQADNLGRDMEVLPPVGPGGTLAGRLGGRLSDLIDCFVRDRSIYTMISERTGLPDEVIAKRFQQVQPFILYTVRGLLAGIADNFKMIPGVIEFSVRVRNEGNWQAVLKLAANRNLRVTEMIRQRGEAQVREAWLKALVLHEQNRTMATLARQPFIEPLPTLESVLGIVVPTAAPAPASVPAPAEQDARKKAAEEEAKKKAAGEPPRA